LLLLLLLPEAEVVRSRRHIRSTRFSSSIIAARHRSAKYHGNREARQAEVQNAGENSNTYIRLCWDTGGEG